MTSMSEFLADRRPPPPPDLADSLRVPEDPGGALDEALSSSALERLQEAEASLGRIRESAFRLLEADALLTYACEAALESEDPDAALGRILAAVGC